MTLTASAAVATPEPGRWVTQSTATMNAGAALATAPKPTTAAVLPMAIKAPVLPSEMACPSVRRCLQQASRVTRQPASRARISAEVWKRSCRANETASTEIGPSSASPGAGNSVRAMIGSSGRS